MLGTLINAVTVTAGSLLGIGLKSRLPKRFTEIVFQVLGVFTLIIGIQMALKTGNVLILVLGSLLGAISGEGLRLEDRITKLSDRLANSQSGDSSRFTQGLVTAFMLFCVGAMTLIGCLDEGIRGDRRIIVTKSLMDFFSSTALASAFGKGVLFSVVPLVLYQGGLTLLATQLAPVLTDEVVAESTACGGLMLMGLGINILEIKKLRIVNMLPGLIFCGLLAALAVHFDIYNPF